MHLPPAAAEALNVAEIRCGTGAHCRLWSERGHQVYGADIDAELVALARRRASESGLTMLLDVASASALPWPDRSMDLCIARGVLEHLPDWRAALAEWLRVLRPGGTLYISTTTGWLTLRAQPATVLPACMSRTRSG